jgi:hypothetical protein
MEGMAGTGEEALLRAMMSGAMAGADGGGMDPMMAAMMMAQQQQQCEMSDEQRAMEEALAAQMMAQVMGGGGGVPGFPGVDPAFQDAQTQEQGEQQEDVAAPSEDTPGEANDSTDVAAAAHHAQQKAMEEAFAATMMAGMMGGMMGGAGEGMPPVEAYDTATFDPMEDNVDVWEWEPPEDQCRVVERLPDPAKDGYRIELVVDDAEEVTTPPHHTACTASLSCRSVQP